SSAYIQDLQIVPVQVMDPLGENQPSGAQYQVIRVTQRWIQPLMRDLRQRFHGKGSGSITSCLRGLGYIHCMRAILAGGGTGGHVIPALAIAQELRTQYGAEIEFIGTARGIENRLVPAAGFPLSLVEVGALKNVSFTTRLKTSFDLPRAIWAARGILARFRPDVVIGVGGYASGPAMLAAIMQRIPTLAFEPNVVPGFANRLVARM